MASSKSQRSYADGMPESSTRSPRNRPEGLVGVQECEFSRSHARSPFFGRSNKGGFGPIYSARIAPTPCRSAYLSREADSRLANQIATLASRRKEPGYQGSIV